jgi:hypothetical protein
MYKFCVYHCRGCCMQSLLVTELFILEKKKVAVLLHGDYFMANTTKEDEDMFTA